MYQGFFDWPGGIGGFETNYKVSRVPWLAAGWVVTRAVGGYWAEVVLAAAAITSLSVLAFLLARRFFVPWISLFIALGLAYWPFMYHGGGGGWLYHNTMLGPLLLGAVLCAVVAADTNRRPTTLRAGAGFGALALAAVLLATHALVLLAPVVIFVLLLATGERLQRLITFGLGLVLGASATYAALGIFSLAAGNRFFFHLPLWDYLQAQRLPENKAMWWQPLSTGWLDRASYLALPAVAILLSVVAAFVSARVLWNGGALSRTAVGLVAGSAVATFTYIVLYWQGFQSLDNQYIAFPLQLAGGVGVISASALIVSAHRSNQCVSGNSAPLEAWWAVPGIVAWILPATVLASSRWLPIAEPLDAIRYSGFLIASAWTVAVFGTSSLAIWAAWQAGLQGGWALCVAPIAAFSLMLPFGMALVPRVENFQPGTNCSANGVAAALLADVRKELVRGAGAAPSPNAPVIWGDPGTGVEPGVACYVDPHDVANSLVASVQTSALLSWTLERTPAPQIDKARLAMAASAGQVVILSSTRRGIVRAIHDLQSVGLTNAKNMAIARIGDRDGVVYLARQESP